ncbi:MAG: prepilin-type N-terminal cleavage/methylation domain-containing protein [Fibrobacteria bacterium]|nr:prepilin-type N-terminal cleavage/methylation domain-containing protein [Fibrobacteria bacterium]
MKNRTKGFTLVELMVVIVIIGVLAALAIPRFLGATDKTKAAEFKPVLKQMLTLQEAFKQEADVYGTSLTLIGFEVPAGHPRFAYSMTAGTNTYIGSAVLNSNSIRTYTGTATIKEDGVGSATADLLALSNWRGL